MAVETVAAVDRSETPVWVRTLPAGRHAGGDVGPGMGHGCQSSRSGEAIVVGALGNPFNIGQTVVITGILILTALAAAIPFTARLWNVGGEGQMTVGAIAAGVLGIVLPGTWSRWLLVPVVLIGSMVAGSLYGAILGG